MMRFTRVVLYHRKCYHSSTDVGISDETVASHYVKTLCHDARGYRTSFCVSPAPIQNNTSASFVISKMSLMFTNVMTWSDRSLFWIQINIGKFVITKRLLMSFRTDMRSRAVSCNLTLWWLTLHCNGYLHVWGSYHAKDSQWQWLWLI